jgi:hypothetical protein
MPSPSRAETSLSPPGSAACCPLALPIAHAPIGKAPLRGFRIRARNGGALGAPESLPPKSEIGDGR